MSLTAAWDILSSVGSAIQVSTQDEAHLSDDSILTDPSISG